MDFRKYKSLTLNQLPQANVYSKKNNNKKILQYQYYNVISPGPTLICILITNIRQKKGSEMSRTLAAACALQGQCENVIY